MKKIIVISLAAVLLILGAASLKLVLFEREQSRISQGTVIDKCDTVKAALLVIDIQECTTGMTSDNEYYRTESTELINHINVLIDRASAKNLPVIYVRNEISDWFINLLNDSMEKGSVGAAFDRRLKISGDLLLSKSTSDTFRNPSLDSILAAKRINELYVCGLDAAFCVNSTLQGAKNRGYKLNVLSDAVISETDSLTREMLGQFSRDSIRVISSNDFLR